MADIRLRLIIRRHGLPEAKLVWPCAASDDLTVSSLLSQVNEVFPLESDQWGLEDYAMELADQSGGSFECLHFQQVGKLLKQDDQVVIRSLLTEDLRQRRISGRHQISGDGIHLVDGIPFGRRRGPRDRPALVLPPRKRARIVYDSSRDEDEEVEDLSRLLLEDTPGPNEDEGSTDNDDDGDFDEDDESGENYEEDPADDDLEEELQFLQADSGIPNGDISHRENPRRGRREDRDEAAASSQLLKLEGMTPAALVALRAAFPLAPLSILEAKLVAHGSNLEATYRDLASANDPELNYNGMMAMFMEIRFNHVSAPEPALLPETPKASRPLIQEVEDVQAPEQSAAIDSSNTTTESMNGVAALGDPSEGDESSSDSDNEPEPASATRDSDDESSSGSDDSDFNNADVGLEGSENDASSSSGSPSAFSEEDKTRETGVSLESAGPDSGSSDGSMRGMSNGNARVKGTKNSKVLIQDVTTNLPTNQSSADEDGSLSDSSGEASDSNGSSSSEDDAESSSGPEQVSSIFKKAFPDAGSSDSSDPSHSSSSSDPINVCSHKFVDKAANDNSSSSSGSSYASLVAEPEISTYRSPEKRVHEGESLLDEAQATSVAEQHSGIGRGQGLSRTQKRNARRRLAKEKLREQEQLKLNPKPAPAAQLNASAGDVPADEETELAAIADPTLQQDVAMEDVILLQKRAELTKAIEDAQVAPDDSISSASESSSDSSSNSGSGSEPEEETAKEEGTRPKIGAVESMDIEQAHDTPSTVNSAHPGADLATTLLPVDSSGFPVTTPNTAKSTDENARKRMRVDMGAGRRLLFGALGLKNPKNKSDEEKLKKDLMKDVRPHQNPRQENSEKAAEPAATVVPQGAEEHDWRDKITYRAVECCYEGMVLSEPPFPFVQRWDPQQQYNSMRKRKRDSQHFEEYYDEVSWYGMQDKSSSKKMNKNKKRTAPHRQLQQEEMPLDDADIELNYDDTPTKPEAGDLPSLPADPNALSPIHLDETKVGMVITWQCLQLSKATNWQPQVQWVTGMIVSKDFDKIHLVLAKRDRDQDERVFNEDGNRMYDKFEMPEEDELEDEYNPDDGHRDMFWGDLTDARLVQGEPPPSMLNSPLGESFERADVDFFADQAVASSQAPASSRNDVDSLHVRAGVENLADIANEGQQLAISSTIPSGQDCRFMDVAQPTMKPSNSNSSEEPSQPSTSDKTARGGCLEAQYTSINGPPLQDSLDEHVAATDDEAMADADNGVEDQDAHDTPSVNVASATSQPDGQEGQTPPIGYPQLPAPSSASSLRSGRQPQSDFAEPINDDDDGTPGPETGSSALPDSTHPSQEDDVLSKEEDNFSKAKSRSRKSSSDSFPSLDDIWHTAKTSKTQQSPLKSSQGSALVHKNKKVKYEPAISSQRSGNEDRLDGNKSSRNLFPNATQPAPEAPTLASSQSPRRSSRRRSQPKSTAFVIPEGSQVINLSSSPLSERFDENYAEDDVDDTYEDPGTSSLPKGDGWVSKRKPGRGRPRG